jgi:putative addiction module killer protein
MFDVVQTAEFMAWLANLSDLRAQRRVVQRLERARVGLLGDVKYFDGIGEMRIDSGPGYRLYFVRQGSRLIVLLCGGDKSTQSRDIRRALTLAKEV